MWAASPPGAGGFVSEIKRAAGTETRTNSYWKETRNNLSQTGAPPSNAFPTAASATESLLEHYFTPNCTHWERHKMLLVLMLASPPRLVLLTRMHREVKNSDPIDGMWTLSTFPWQQQKCLQPLSLAEVRFLWKWRRHCCVWASLAANVLILCTVQECVHIWLWLNELTQRCSENNVHVQNWKFDSPEAGTRAVFSGFGQFRARLTACSQKKNYITFYQEN